MSPSLLGGGGGVRRNISTMKTWDDDVDELIPVRRNISRIGSRSDDELFPRRRMVRRWLVMVMCISWLFVCGLYECYYRSWRCEKPSPTLRVFDPTLSTAAQQQQRQQQQLLVVITPTYTRQKLNPKSATRVFRKYTLSQMFISMCYATTGGGTDVWWYLIDENISDPIPSFADKCAHVHVTRLPAPPPSNTTSKHRGVDHRNTGLEHALRDHKGKNAAVYFADDDNLYAPTLWATAAGASHDALLWPVGWMEDKVGGDAPVHTNGEIHGFQTKFCGKRRKFAIDMAGFAVPLDATANVKFQHEWDKGLLETSFLEGIELQGVRVRAVTTSHDVLAWHVNWKTDDVKNFVMNMPSPRINCAWAKKKNASVG